MLGAAASAGAADTAGMVGIIAGRRMRMAAAALVPIWVGDRAAADGAPIRARTVAGAAADMAAADTVVGTAAVDAADITAEQATTIVIITSRGARIIPGSLLIE